MTCGFSFSSHRITKLTNGLLLSPTISTKIKLFNRSQTLTGIWLLFIFRNPESLTNVVYFDVWPVCVVGRSLTGVIICLGNCEPEEGEIKKQRGREGERTCQLNQQSWVKCVFQAPLNCIWIKQNCSCAPCRWESMKKSWTETPRLPSDDWKHLELKEIISFFNIYCSSRHRITFSIAKSSTNEWRVGLLTCMCIHLCALSLFFN